MKSSKVGYKTSKYSHPVVLIPGMGHASFLSGIPPPTVQKTDLRATISPSEAVRQVSDVTAAFLTIHNKESDSKAAEKIIDHYIDSITAPYREPYLKRAHMEGNPDFSSFRNTTPWV